jgi:arylsulfatase A-like enzyme
MSVSKLARVLPVLLALAGVTAVAAAFAVDLLGWGEESGFGMNQLRAVMLGLALVALAKFVGWANRHGGVLAVIKRFWATSPRGRPLQLLVLILWFGVAAGIFEVGHRLVRKYGFGDPLKQPLELIWMIPLSLFALAIVPAIVLAALTRFIPRGLPLPIAALPVVYLVAHAQLRMYPWYGLTVTFLAIGVAIVVGRSLHARGAAWLKLARRTLLPLMVLVAVAGLALPALRAFRESRAMAALPAAPEKATSVLFVVLDTVRADHVRAYGYPRETTPRIDALAADGVLFEQAISTAPWTLPSHGTMFTGHYHRDLSTDWLVPLDDTHPTLAEEFAARGYATGGFVGNLRFCASEWGIDRGFAHYEDFYVEPDVIAFSSTLGKSLASRYGQAFHEFLRNDAAEVSARCEQWIDSLGDRPFFAFVNYFDAHAYYLAPPPFDTKFGTPSPLLRAWHDPKRKWTPEQMQGFIDGYDGCIAYIDERLGALLDRLRARGRLDDTLVVVVGDHGDLFGEHGLTDHGNSLYRPLLHVPMVLWQPSRLPRGTRVAQPVSVRDLAATVLDLTGVAPRRPFPGCSLAPLSSPGSADPALSLSPLFAEITKGVNTPPSQPNTKGNMLTLFAEGRQYIRGGDGAEELYDLSADPGREENVVADPAEAMVLQRMREQVQQMEVSR